MMGERISSKVTPSPTGEINTTILKKIACFGLLCGFYIHNDVKIGSRVDTFSYSDLDGESSNCCWLCGYCQYKTYIKPPGVEITVNKKRAEWTCCCGYDFEGIEYCCGIPFK